MPYLLYRRGVGYKSCQEIAARSETGIQVLRSDRIPYQGRMFETVFRWGCTSRADAHRIINPARIIAGTSDKVSFRMLCQNEEVRVPRTWVNLTMFDEDSFETPKIVRPARHAYGRHVYLARDMKTLTEATEACGEGYYISDFTDKMAEYRVHVISGRVVGVARKIPANESDIAWNRHLGAKFRRIQPERWRLRTIREALKAFRLSKLDFGAVDVMIDRAEQPFILEINTAPTVRSWFHLEYAKAFDHIVRNETHHYPEASGRGFENYIHPEI